MSGNPIDIRDSLLDAARFSLNGPSRTNRDHREVLSRCKRTRA